MHRLQLLWWGVVVATATVASCAQPQKVTASHAPPPPSPTTSTSTSSQTRAQPPPFAAELSRTQDGWHVTYRFAVPQTALLFDTGHGAYRTTSWTSTTSGVELVHLEGIDGMFFASPTSEVAFDITPPTLPVEGTNPILAFSDGSAAFYTGQLALLTVDSRAAAEALHGSLRHWRGDQPAVVVHPTPGAGDVLDDDTIIAQHGRGPYVYRGAIAPSALNAGRAVVDPGLPFWLQERFAGDLSAIDEVLQRQWTTPVPPVTALLAWAGAIDPWRNAGRAESPQIAMTVQGSIYVDANDKALRKLVWFFAHERVHHHQNQPGVALAPWALEGGADAMATDVVAAIGLLTPEQRAARFVDVQRACAADLNRLPAPHDVNGSAGSIAYGCGELVADVTRAIVDDHDLVAFWERLLHTAQAQGAHVDASFYAFVLQREGHADAAKHLEAFLTTHPDDGKRAVVSLLTSTMPHVVVQDDGWAIARVENDKRP